MLILREKIGFTCGSGSICGAMALMGYFVAVKPLWWLIVGCRYEIDWIIVDWDGGSSSFIILRVLFSVLLSQMTSFDRAL